MKFLDNITSYIEDAFKRLGIKSQIAILALMFLAIVISFIYVLNKPAKVTELDREDIEVNLKDSSIQERIDRVQIPEGTKGAKLDSLLIEKYYKSVL